MCCTDRAGLEETMSHACELAACTELFCGKRKRVQKRRPMAHKEIALRRTYTGQDRGIKNSQNSNVSYPIPSSQPAARATQVATAARAPNAHATASLLQPHQQVACVCVRA